MAETGKNQAERAHAMLAEMDQREAEMAYLLEASGLNDEEWIRQNRDKQFKDCRLAIRFRHERLDIHAMRDLLFHHLRMDCRRNLLSFRVEYGELPRMLAPENADAGMVTALLEMLAAENIKATDTKAFSLISLIADENRYNPIEDMLKSAPWDGEDRLMPILRILGITHDSFSMALVMKWLHQTVAMALNDETNPYGADGVLTLQGPQGVGKTQFFRVLAMKPKWFVEGMLLDLTNKDSILLANSGWICELGEVDATLKQKQQQIKGFITQVNDRVREPYQRHARDCIRRMSLCATVNPEQFLRDDTGSRRFWVVPVERIDLDALGRLDEAFLQQMWAQVYESLYRPDPQGFRLTGDERRALEARNSRHDRPDPVGYEIQELLDWDMPQQQWNWFKARDLVTRLHINTTSEKIGRALSKLSERDARIQMNIYSGVKRYRLPLKKYG